MAALRHERGAAACGTGPHALARPAAIPNNAEANPMTAVPFPVTSSPGARAQEGAGRLINGHVVKTEQGAPTPLKWTSSPGLAETTTTTHTWFCGFVEYNGSIISFLANRVALLSKSAGAYGFSDLG